MKIVRVIAAQGLLSPGPLFVFRRVTFWIFISFALAIFFVLYGIFISRL